MADFGWSTEDWSENLDIQPSFCAVGGSFGPRDSAGLGGHLTYAMNATLASRGRYVCVMPPRAVSAR